MHKISQDWADESIEWGHVKALFLIHLRGFRSQSSISLRCLVRCYFQNEEKIKSICDYIECKDGLGICFILDGLDEYQPDDKTVFIFQLIEKKVLSKAIVIVASRPAAVAKYRSTGRHIEVLGFFKDQISDYIDSYEFRCMSSSSLLKTYLADRPNIHHMCYLPIQLAMICFLYDLFEKDGDEFPDTETDVYEQFARHMLIRTFYRQNIDMYLKSIFSLPEVKGRLFRSICTLAFEKTLSSKQVLEQSEVDIFCEKMNTNSSLGLLTVDRKATKCGFQNMYTFCHLTFQEFLAACHIFLSSEVNQSKLIVMCNEKEHMTVVLKFFCGLAGYETDFCTTFKNVMKSHHLNCLAKVHCAYESKQPAVCQYVAENSTLNITENFLTTRDWSCIGFIIVNTSDNPVNSLYLNVSGITEEGTQSFKKILKGNRKALKIEILKIFGNFHYIPQSFLENLYFLRILSVTMNETTEYWSKFFSKLNLLNINIIHYYEDSIAKLSVKFGFSLLLESLSSCYENIRTSNNLSQNTMYIPNQILEKSFKSRSPFLAKECNSLLNEVCTSNKCIKLSCTKVKDADNIMMTIESGDRRIIKDVKNICEIFADNYHGGSATCEDILNCLDLISLVDQMVLVYTQTSLAESRVVIYILPNTFVIEEFMNKRKHITSIQNLFIKRIPDGMRLHSTGGRLKLQNADLRRMCIAKNDFDLNKKLDVVKLMSQSIEQLHINTIDDSFVVPESVMNCINLKYFSLHMNKPSFNIVANSIRNMRNLINALAFSDLQILDIRHCNLSAIIDSSLLPALKNWINLTELGLKNCSITEKDMIYVAEGIKASSHLNTLDLSDNKIGDKGCQALAVSLYHECISGKCSSPHLHKLNLSCCHIGESGIVALAGSIQQNCDIKVLDLSGNSCQSTVIPVLFGALQSCKNLSILNLSHLSIGDLSVFSTLNSNSVEVLNLCACEADLSSLNSLAECTSLLSSLCVLDMSEYNWPMTELAQVLNHAHNLQELSLSQISFASTDTKEFVRVLKLVKNLKLLRLSHARVHGCNDFASIVKSETLEVFEISHLKCSASEYFCLCENIKFAPSLCTLNLSYIHFIEHQSFEINVHKGELHPSPYNNAAIALSKSLPFCSNLQELKLTDCGIK